MKNLLLQQKLKEYENACRAKEDNEKFIPKLKRKTCDIIDLILKAKKKAKLKTREEALHKIIYEVNPQFLKEQEEEINKNRKRRFKKYGRA